MKLSLQPFSPVFGGSTGGWLRSAEFEEKHLIIWPSPKEQIFEMPTGGAGVMSGSENLGYFVRKEQCMSLGEQLKNFKINKYKVYRIFPCGEVQFLHPKDGVFPEKVNPGRLPVGNRNFSIGQNPNPVSVKFSGIATYEK